MGGEKPRNRARTYLLGLAFFIVTTCLYAVPVIKTVTLSWQHELGPYSYHVYESDDVTLPMANWMLKTNVTDLNVRLEVETGARYFTVTCVDTNSGLESSYATP